MLRKVGVVEKFVEYFGPGMKSLSVTDRATIANMTPEYGATLGFFPIDEKTLEYLVLTGRGDRARLVDAYCKQTGMFYTGESDPEFTQVVELDLSTVEPSLAGPARPQDRIVLPDLKRTFADILGCKYDRDEEIKRISAFHDESGVQSTSRQTVPTRSPTAVRHGTQWPADQTRRRKHRRCRDHVVYQHLKPACAHGRRSDRKKCRGQGSQGAAICEDLPGPGFKSGGWTIWKQPV